MTAKAKPKNPPETYYAGAYWGARKESPEECARRTAEFLTLLAASDPFLSQWYLPTRSSRESREYPLMPPDVPTLTEQFRLGVNREKGGPVIERLGYGFWFGNGGRDYDRASLRIYSGGYSEAGSNSCVLALPTLGRSPNAERMMTAPVLTEIVRSMALAWEPEWAVAMSHAHRDLEDTAGKGDICLGWVTYLSRHQGTVPPLPAPVRIELVEDKGTLIILTSERFTAANPEHIVLARQVRELLAQAGLMQSASS